MNSFKALVVICLIMTVAIASPVPPADSDPFAELLWHGQLASPTKQNTVVKRRIYDNNSDRELKQISLSSLVGDLEQSLFASALSVNKLLTDKDLSVPEIKPNDSTQHDVNKRQSLPNDATSGDETMTNSKISTSTTTARTTTATNVNNIVFPVETQNVILQTTERVAESPGKPAHIIIDRIAIQPHTAGVALIPIIELKHARTDDELSKDHDITKITISKTEITSLPNVVPETEPASSINSTSIITSTSTVAPSSTKTTTEATAIETSTTPKNIEQLKEAEEELKEKVAEIEAEPIILSARV